MSVAFSNIAETSKYQRKSILRGFRQIKQSSDTDAQL